MAEGDQAVVLASGIVFSVWRSGYEFYVFDEPDGVTHSISGSTVTMESAVQKAWLVIG